MTFFETLLLLLLVAIALLQISRRLLIPYPAMMAASGVVVALIPGSPTINIEPRTALALFIAPALLDAAFDFSAATAKRFWRPLVALAVFAVLATIAVVAWIGWAFAGLPIAAAVVLGAIVAPPDAAAATAVLTSISVPKSTATILRGESLFNDATALLIFSAALTLQETQSVSLAVGTHVALAAPAGLLLGIGLALVFQRLNPYVSGTLGGSVLQFVIACLVWIIAERLEVSAVLCVVAFAMTLARSPEVTGSVRMRVHSYAVWATVVFLLNLLAFLIMGMQAQTILNRFQANELAMASKFVGLVVVAVIVTRMVVVIAFNRLAVRFDIMRRIAPPPTLRQGILLGWAGMRGLVTLATAFALPDAFPQRDLVVLTAFAVVLATLVLQGLTLAPMIRLLRLDCSMDRASQLTHARSILNAAALASLDGVEGPEAENLRYNYSLEQGARTDLTSRHSFERYRELGLRAIAVERVKLRELFAEHDVDGEGYNAVQEELDWKELTLLPDDQRQIQES